VLSVMFDLHSETMLILIIICIELCWFFAQFLKKHEKVLRVLFSLMN